MERNEAIEVIKKNYPHVTESGSQFETALRLLIPELKESEGEGIRKALLEMVHDTTGDSLWVDYNVHKEDAIAWLEKQGEQKPAEEYNITGIGSKNAEGKLGEMIKKLKPVNEVLEQKPTDITNKLKEEYQRGWDAAMQQLPKEIDSQIWQIANNSAKTWEESFAILCASQKAYDKGKKDALKEQNSTWSEEDECCINQLIVFCENCMVQDSNAKKCADWLKSLKERYTWKPSDEQMKALEDSIEFLGCTKKVREDLKSLHEQLKKLKG